MQAGSDTPYRFLYEVRRLTLILITAVLAAIPAAAQRTAEPDSKQLGKALDYFSGGKYHEALTLFRDLDKRYQFNPRFKAYIGVCHFYEWDYEDACRYLDNALPYLGIYSPQEQSIYYYTDAESHFNLQEYSEAVPLYEKLLSVCKEDERGNTYYRIGCCRMFLEEWSEAAESFRKALECYKSKPVPNSETRINQLPKMIKGAEAKLSELHQQQAQ